MLENMSQALVLRVGKMEALWEDRLAAEVARCEKAAHDVVRMREEHQSELEVLEVDSLSKEQALEKAIADAQIVHDNLGIMHRNLMKVAKAVVGKPFITL